MISEIWVNTLQFHVDALQLNLDSKSVICTYSNVGDV